MKKFTATFKGDFPSMKFDNQTKKKYSDLRIGYNTYSFEGTDAEFSLWLEQFLKNNNGLKCIGIDY